MQTIELPITEKYVSSWDYWDALREFLQNAIDSKKHWELTYHSQMIIIDQEDTVLPIQSLLLGETTKTDSDTIGGFGEGYKLALLTLLRKQCIITILNGNEKWTPCFKTSSIFNVDTLHIDIEPHPHTANLRICIQNIPQIAYDELQEKCLRLSKQLITVEFTSYGSILLDADKAGKLYTGGLYVCEIDAAYGYTIDPQYIQLERDRKTVDNFDFRRIAQKMWIETQEWNLIVDLIEKDIPEFAYIDSLGNADIAKTCADRLRGMLTCQIPIAPHERSYYYSNGYTEQQLFVTSPELARCARQQLTSDMKKIIPLKSPSMLLEHWLRLHYKNIDKRARSSMLKIIKDAAKWTSN